MRTFLMSLLSLSLAGALTPPGWAAPAETPAPLSDARVRTLLKEAGACEVLHPSRCEPLKTLVSSGGRGTQELIKALKSGVPEVRASAAAALGQLRTVVAGEALLGLLSDPDSRVVHAAITAVGRIKPKGGVDALTAALKNSDPSVAVAAAYALGSTRSPRAIDPLLKALTHEKARVRASAARSLGSIGSARAAFGLSTLLADPESRWPAREAAARSLGLIKSTDGVAMLLLMVGDPEPRVRLAAIDSLGLIGDPRGVTALVLMLREVDYGQAAAGSLGRIKSVDALPALIRVLKDRDLPLPIIEKSFWAIGAIGSSSSVSALKPFLKDEDPQFAVWAADALGRVGDLSAKVELFEALKREELQVKEMAAWALQKLSGFNLGLDVDRWESWVFAEDSVE